MVGHQRRRQQLISGGSAAAMVRLSFRRTAHVWASGSLLRQCRKERKIGDGGGEKKYTHSPPKINQTRKKEKSRCDQWFVE